MESYDTQYHLNTVQTQMEKQMYETDRATIKQRFADQ